MYKRITTLLRKIYETRRVEVSRALNIKHAFTATWNNVWFYLHLNAMRLHIVYSTIDS